MYGVTMTMVQNYPRGSFAYLAQHIYDENHSEATRQWVAAAYIVATITRVRH